MLRKFISVRDALIITKTVFNSGVSKSGQFSYCFFGSLLSCYKHTYSQNIIQRRYVSYHSKSWFRKNGFGRNLVSTSRSARSDSGPNIRLQGVVRGGFLVGLGFMEFFAKKEELTMEETILMEIKRAILAIKEGDIAKAEQHLAQSWKLSNQENLEPAKTQIMDIQANLSFQKGELDKAEKLFKLVAQRLVNHQGVEVTDNSIVEISIKLAQIYRAKGQQQEAMDGFQFCVDTQRQKIKKEGIEDEDTLLLAAWSLHNLSQIYTALGSSGQVNRKIVAVGKELATEAYTYTVKALGADSQQAVAVACDLAGILAVEGDIEGAIKQYEECNKIAEEKHKFMQASIRVNTGTLFLQQGKYTDAEKVCKEAKLIARKVMDNESIGRAQECITKSSDLKKLSEQNAIASSQKKKTETV